MFYLTLQVFLVVNVMVTYNHFINMEVWRLCHSFSCFFGSLFHVFSKSIATASCLFMIQSITIVPLYFMNVLSRFQSLHIPSTTFEIEVTKYLEMDPSQLHLRSWAYVNLYLLMRVFEREFFCDPFLSCLSMPLWPNKSYTRQMVNYFRAHCSWI